MQIILNKLKSKKQIYATKIKEIKWKLGTKQ